METFQSTESSPEANDHSRELLELRYDTIQFPSLVTRIKAVFIDAMIMLAIFALASVSIDAVGDIPDFAKGALAISMFYLYDPLLTHFTGSTLGHKAMNLKVRRYEEPEKRIALGQAFLRFVAKGGLGWISFLTVTGDKRKRAIHDFASGSIIMMTK